MKQREKKFTVIACNAFRDAITYLNFAQRFPNVKFRYLPASLHLRPVELKKHILREIRALAPQGGKVACLYGQCFPDIDNELEKEKVIRIDCSHCYEAMLGKKQFAQVIEEQPGSFFMEKELIVNFQKDCWEPLELGDAELRQLYFQHYRQVVYIRQPRDPDLTSSAKNISDGLGLDLKVYDADYEELNTKLTDLLKNIKN